MTEDQVPRKLAYEQAHPGVIMDDAGDPRAAGADPVKLRWRHGRHVRRHLYAQLGDEPSGDDPYIGTVETAALAVEVCTAHNERLRGRGA